MTITIQIIKIFFVVLFMFAGIMHIIKPNVFKHFIPNSFPKKAVNYIVGIVEFSLGMGLLFKETIAYAAVGIFILLTLFLPIHLWDATKIRPAIGSKKMAFIRIPLQFLLMYFTYLIYTKS